MRNPFSLLLGLFLSLTGCMSSPPLKPDIFQRGDYSYLKTYLTWLIEHEMSGQGVEGLSIVLVDDQQVVWAHGFGYADRANNVRASPETVYRTGSISKLFTDTLVMQLADQGKLDIDKPLQTYLPDFSIKTRFPEAGPITLRAIMSHHAGLPGDIGNGMWTRNPAPFGQLVSQIKEDYAAYPPNTIWSYSNLGITLLGAMLQHITGEDFSVYAGRQLLKPLGMTNAVFSPGIEGRLASKAYKDHRETAEVPLRDTPAGGLNASVLDLSRFVKMVFADGMINGQRILEAETLKEMLSTQNNAVALDVGFQVGLGWFLHDNPNIGTIAEHDGATLYHHSRLSLAPEHKLGVVILANSHPSGDLMEKIGNEALKLAIAIKTGKKPVETIEPEIENRPLTSQELDAGAGQYATLLGYVKLTPEDGALVTEMNGSTLDLIAREDGKYSLRYKLLGFIPILLDKLAKFSLSLQKIAGHDLILAYSNDQTFVVGEKIKPVPIPEDFRGRLGEYEIINLPEGEAVVPEQCALRMRDGFLMLEYSLPMFDINNLVIPITPVSENEAVILGLGRGARETVRIVKIDGKELIAYSGYLLRKKLD